MKMSRTGKDQRLAMIQDGVQAWVIQAKVAAVLAKFQLHQAHLHQVPPHPCRLLPSNAEAVVGTGMIVEATNADADVLV